jgi:hypothetical protein
MHMNLRRAVGPLAAVIAVSAAVFLYSAHPVKSSDHQDTYNLANRPNTSADITDVFVFPSTNPANVVLVLNVSPLIPAGMGPSKFFDPTLMWQFKISHQATGAEDQVIQMSASAVNGTSQTITVYGPSKPNEIGTSNTFVASTGSVPYNVAAGTTLSNGIVAFAGPRADPFFFDLFQFFTFLGDRNAGMHTSQSDVGPGTTNYTLSGSTASAPTFNGFAAGTNSSTNSGFYACSNAAPVNALTDIGGGFNVLSFVLEVPRTLLTTGFASPKIGVWATANSATGS